MFNADPEYTRQYETGVKSSWLDDRLSTTLSAYQIERFNIRYRPDAQMIPILGQSAVNIVRVAWNCPPSGKSFPKNSICAVRWA